MRILHLSDYGGPYSGSFVPMLRSAADAARDCGHETGLVFSGSPSGRAWPAELEAAGLPPRFVPLDDAGATARAIG
ncbi:MAG TPA: hypothetical protein VFT42_06250, partial [Solirubrobacteraceae bacterium]|nr:hypothetical protein [Solirubrobacteraceae bacterium]